MYLWIICVRLLCVCLMELTELFLAKLTSVLGYIRTHNNLMQIIQRYIYYGMSDTNQYDNTRAVNDTGVMMSYNNIKTHGKTCYNIL